MTMKHRIARRTLLAMAVAAAGAALGAAAQNYPPSL